MGSMRLYREYGKLEIEDGRVKREGRIGRGLEITGRDERALDTKAGRKKEE